MPVFFLLLLLLLLQAPSPTPATLPATVGDTVHVPGDYLSSVAIPVLSPGALAGRSIDPTDPAVLPLVILTLDIADPFVAFLTHAPTSMDAFLRQGPDAREGDNAHFLFTAWDSRAEVMALRGRFAARLTALGPAESARWEGRLLFTNGSAQVLMKAGLGSPRGWSGRGHFWWQLQQIAP